MQILTTYSPDNPAFNNSETLDLKNKSMKTIKIALTISLLFILASCEKTETAPSEAIAGTWKIKSIVADFAGQSNVDVYAFLGAFFPCVYDVTYTFSASGMVTSDDKGCVDDVGDSNAIISKSGATYTLENGVLTVTDGGEVLTGNITFSGKTAVWTSNDPSGESDKAVTTFEKVD